MRNLFAGALVVGLALATGAPSLAAKEKMMVPKCKSPDVVVMVDTKTKMYHGMKDGKSHKMMMASGDKTMLTCKSKADAMGAKMLMAGKPAM